MSYSLSFQIDSQHCISEEDVALKMEQHIHKDLELLRQHKIIITPEDVHFEDITYAPEHTSGLVGINVHAINFGFFNSLYYNHIIKYYSRLYGEKEYAPFSDNLLSYFYFDEDKTYLVTNEIFEETQMRLYHQNEHIFISPANPFLLMSKPKMRNFFFNRKKKKIANLLDIN